MIFEIDGKDTELKFGVGFVKKLDAIHEVEVNGIPFGAGLMLAGVGLEQKNPTTLLEIIICATPSNITERKVETALDRYAEENDGFEELFEEIQEELGKSPVTKGTMNHLKEQEN